MESPSSLARSRADSTPSCAVRAWWDPARQRVRQYEVMVAPGAGLQAGPYVAETFPVSVDQQYVVVTVGEMASRDDTAVALAMTMRTITPYP